jgi:hypothetical protein
MFKFHINMLHISKFLNVSTLNYAIDLINTSDLFMLYNYVHSYSIF